MIIYALFMCTKLYSIYAASGAHSLYYDECDPIQAWGMFVDAESCQQVKTEFKMVDTKNPAMERSYVCMKKDVPSWEPVAPPQAPKPPEAFAWRMGEKPPPGVTADKDGMPDGYEIRSGMNHNCFAPKCLWFEKEK